MTYTPSLVKSINARVKGGRVRSIRIGSGWWKPPAIFVTLNQTSPDMDTTEAHNYLMGMYEEIKFIIHAEEEE